MDGVHMFTFLCGKVNPWVAVMDRVYSNMLTCVGVLDQVVNPSLCGHIT